jgi:hypothetical protein
MCALSGCGKGNPAQQAIDGASTAAQWQREYQQLKSLGAAYLAVIYARKQGPAGWHELPQTPEITELQQAGCIVSWGKGFHDAKQGTSSYVLAYLPDVPEKGGAVLFMDGAVRRMSSQEANSIIAAQGQ